MGFFIRWLWSKLKFILLRVPTDFENDQDKTVITSIQSFWVTRPSRSDLGAISARFWQACGAWRKFWGLEATMRQYRYEFICFRTGFCFVNILVPLWHSYGFTFKLYGSQFSGEKKHLEIWCLVADILSKTPV